jgi:hypothetical protein
LLESVTEIANKAMGIEKKKKTMTEKPVLVMTHLVRLPLHVGEAESC